MIELGKCNELYIVKKVDFGVYLSDEEHTQEILLPRKEVPQNAQPGNKIMAFIYRDSSDRLIATTRQPYIQLGEVALLRVRENGKIGAFLDWGLEKDLLLPFREQTGKVAVGQECLVALYVDKSRRLCATMKVYHYLHTDSSYQKDDIVEGIVYEISDQFGTFVAVDNRYSALIPRREPANLHVGDRIKARITNVLEDGKLSLSMREKAYLQMNTDADLLLRLLDEQGGELLLGDKSSPEEIREKTGMSKNEFKRAAGSLYRQRRIEIEDEKIRRV